MVRYCFKHNGCSVDPLPPQEMEPDGIDVLSLEQAAALTGIDEENLRARWDAMYGDYVPPAKTPYTKKVKSTVTMPAKPDLPSDFVFKIGTTAVYKTYITTEHLVRKDGSPAMGLCLGVEKRILVNSHFPKESWLDT